MVYYKLDRSFLIEKSNLFLRFEFPIDVNDLKITTNLRLFVYLINHNLRHFFFEESRRENICEINATPK
jgi:hypothetical protein